MSTAGPGAEAGGRRCAAAATQQAAAFADPLAEARVRVGGRGAGQADWAGASGDEGLSPALGGSQANAVVLLARRGLTHESQGNSQQRPGRTGRVGKCKAGTLMRRGRQNPSPQTAALFSPGWVTQFCGCSTARARSDPLSMVRPPLQNRGHLL